MAKSDTKSKKEAEEKKKLAAKQQQVKSSTNIFSPDINVSDIGFFGPNDSRDVKKIETKNINLGLPTAPKPLTKTQQRLMGTGLGLDPVTGGQKTPRTFGEVKTKNNKTEFSPLNIDRLSNELMRGEVVDNNKSRQATATEQRKAMDLVFNQGLMVEGMTNRSKIQPGSGKLPTVFAVASTNNFANPGFASGGGIKLDPMFQPTRAKKENNPNFKATSTRAGYKRATSAATKLNTIDNLARLGVPAAKIDKSFSQPTTTRPGWLTPSSINILDSVSKQQITNISSPLSSLPSKFISTSNFANPNFGGKISSYNPVGITGTRLAPKVQSTFSQDIKLLSAGKSLNDTAARAAIAQASASSNAKLKRISRARNAAKSASLKGNPNLARANAILREQGADYQIGVYTRRRRQSRWETNYVAYYTGPSTRTSYTRTIHNGRRVTAYRGYTTGQRIYGRNTNPDAIVAAYERNNAISSFGAELGITRNPGESTASHAARVTDFSNKRKANIEQYIDPLDLAEQNELGSLTAELSSINRRRDNIKRYRYRSGSSQARAQGRQLAPLNDRASIVQRRIDELKAKKNDNMFAYTGVSDAQIKDIENYYGDLTKNIGDFDSNINILEQGIAKVQAKRGKSTAERTATLFSGKQFDAIEAREKPYDSIIASTSAELANINEAINLNKNRSQIRNNIGRSVNDLMNRGLIERKDTYSVSEAISAIDSKIEAAEKNAAALAARPPVRRSSGNRSAMRAAERANRARNAQVRAARANVSALKGTKAQLEKHGAAVYGGDRINEGVIAKPRNLTIQGTGSRKRTWYRGTTGSTTINIGKDKVPPNGKVVIEATVSYNSGYKGPTHADTTLGKIQGTQTVRKEVPVDANGNIVIQSKMYGINRGYQAKMSVSNIKVIDSTKTSVGADQFGNLSQLQAKQSQLQTTLKENQAVKNYFDSAQDFLMGSTNVLKDKSGKTVASLSGSSLSIADQGAFTDLFGTSNISGETIKASRALGGQLRGLQSREDSLLSQKKSILDREATRGVPLSDTQKSSLTSEAGKLKAQAADLRKRAGPLMAKARNDINNRHHKMRWRAARARSGRATMKAAQGMMNQAAALEAKAKQKEQYRDTGVDPTRPLREDVLAQVGAIDKQIGTIDATQAFLTGQTNQLVFGSGISETIKAVKSDAAKKASELQTKLTTLQRSNARVRSSYGYRKYTKNKTEANAKMKAAENAIAQQIREINTNAANKVKELEAIKDTEKPEVIVAKRGQLGRIDVKEQDLLNTLGVSIPGILKKDAPAAITTKKLATLEGVIKQKEAKQTELINTLKTVQKERIKETAAARVKQIDQLVQKRAITRRDAVKAKKAVAKEVSAQKSAIDSVDGSVPLPDIEVFDNDLKSEAQQILESTGQVVKATKKATAKAKLRQVTRSRKPQASPIGAVLARGATVPRPRDNKPQQPVSENIGRLRNPFVAE